MYNKKDLVLAQGILCVDVICINFHLNTCRFFNVNQLISKDFILRFTRDLLVMVPNFHDQDVDYRKNKIPESVEDWIVAGNICNEEALANFVRISVMRIKVGL